MIQVHYGVVKQADGWAIIGENLRVGGYARRSSAVVAARGWLRNPAACR